MRARRRQCRRTRAVVESPKSRDRFSSSNGNFLFLEEVSVSDFRRGLGFVNAVFYESPAEKRDPKGPMRTYDGTSERRFDAK